jgi:hypothetical protein
MLNPIGAMEKTPSPLLPACFNKPSVIKNAGAPMIVIAVPREAANERGINSLEAGMLFSRENFSIGGSMSAVIVT